MFLREALVLFQVLVAGMALVHFPSKCRSNCYVRNFRKSIPALTASKLYGGDFAGLSANFSPDGALIPVPEYLIPKDLLEWGEHPSCLEVLVSEAEASPTEWSRQTISVLPAVGCGVDNLDTEKKESLLEVQALRVTDDIVSFDVEHEGEKKGRRAETIFSVSIGDDHRLRLILDISSSSETGFTIESPITITLERKVSEISSGGAIADGGGLTGSRVTELMGPHLKVSAPFCNEKPLEMHPEGVKILNLPGNVTIATSEDSKESPWMLDILHFNINEKGEAQQQVVRRSYHFEDDE